MKKPLLVSREQTYSNLLFIVFLQKKVLLTKAERARKFHIFRKCNVVTFRVKIYSFPLLPAVNHLKFVLWQRQEDNIVESVEHVAIATFQK